MRKREFSVIAFIMAFVCVFTCNLDAASAATYTPQLAYVLKGLPKATAVQNFSITSNSIYIVQKEDSKGNLLLTKYNKSNLSKVGTMKLKGFGHGESLEVIRSSNGVETIYIPTGTYVDKGNVWSTQLSRFQFKSGATIYPSQVGRLSGFNYANGRNSSIGTVKRFNFAISSDNKYFIFRIQNTNNYIQYSKYSKSYIDSLLSSSAKSKTAVSMKNRSKYCVKGFYQKKNSTNAPNGSFQGMEVSSYGNIFTSGGATTTAATITKMNSSGSFVKRMTISKWKGYEIEGLHLSGDLYATYKTGTNVAKIYKIPM